MDLDFIDVTNWISDNSTSTPGTRDKVILISPEGVSYFLKFPMIKEGRDYSAENWSEIIAHKVGTELGFNVLKYTLSVWKGKVGCISENMVDTAKENLLEGYSILAAYDPNYNPDDKSSYAQYTFGFVCEALKHKELDEHINTFIKILVFDSIFGNSDRHQGNWGFIQTREMTACDESSGSSPLFRFFKRNKQERPTEVMQTMSRMAPIYDSGCCLGRELSEERLCEILGDDSKLKKYILNGQAELRPDSSGGKKKTHYELLEYISSVDSQYEKYIKNVVKEIKSRYSESKLRNIIENLDGNIPESYKGCSNLTKSRKEFIIKLISERLSILFNTFHVS